MTSSQDLKKEIEKLESEVKEKEEVASLERKREELSRRLYPPKQEKEGFFKGFLRTVARAETNRAIMDAKTPKKPYKAIKFEDIGFKV